MQSNTPSASPQGVPRDLLTVDEVANRLRLSKKTVYRLVEQRHVPFYRLRGALRFDPADLDRYVESLRTPSITDLMYGRS